MTLAEKIQSKKKKLLPTTVFKYFSYFCIACALAALVFIVLFVFIGGAPHLTWGFIFDEYSAFNITLRGVLITTLKTILMSLAIAVPVGVLCAIFLVEYTRRGSILVKIIKVALETLSGVPSIIFGLFGMLIFVDLLGLGLSLWSGSLTLALMILPTIVTTVEESIKAVPDIYREGSFGLGATRLRTVFTIVIPNAIAGILSAVILGTGRIISESACVMFTSGNSMLTPMKFGDGGATLAVAMYLSASEGYLDEAYAIGCILIILIVSINLISTFIAKRFSKKAR